METLAYRDDRAEVHQRVLGRLDTNVYVLRCRRSGEAVMIDAADEAELLAGDCRTLGVTRILLTHGHGDHVQAVPGLRAAGYPVLIGPGDTTMVAGHDGTLEHGSAIAVGELSLRVLATPGHTPGSTCLHLEGAPLVFAGDTLFPGGPGATGGDPERFATILAGIEAHLFSLAPDTLVLPGHGLPTTVGDEAPHLEEWRARGW
ncbi:MAG TPA: MBL fold metallo-hydrolase [Acidimicrobiales bacterium]|nr:MBL fold metallo-hydrolase [Acidimicrobiales bacterium]